MGMKYRYSEFFLICTYDRITLLHTWTNWCLAPADIDLERWANHIKELQPFVVELDGEIAGYADVQPNGYIDHFFVSGTYSRQG